MASGPFTLAQLARAVGMSIEDVRFFGDRGLLQPARRSPGRKDQSAFHREHVDRLNFIKRALELRFTLADISQLVDAEALVTCNDVHQFAERHLLALRRMVDVPAAVVSTLERLTASCSRRGHRSECPVILFLAGPVPLHMA